MPNEIRDGRERRDERARAFAEGRVATNALLSHASMDAVVAFDAGQAIDVAGFLRDVHALAQRLPEREFVLNACANRYLFTVALCAALLRRQVTLLPSSQSAATMQALARSYAGLYALNDRPETGAFKTIAVARAPPGSAFDVAYDIPSLASEQVALILFTSGSTGHPVPTAKTWGSLVYSAQSEALALGIAANRGLAILGTVPAQHSYGLESTVLLALHNGLALASEHPFYPADVCAVLQALPRPRMLVTTPVHLRALCVVEGALPEADLVLSATAALPLELATLAQARFHAPVMEIYGCSEAGQLAARTPTQSPHWALMRDIRLRQDASGTWVCGGHVPAETLLADVIESVSDTHFTLHGRTADLINIAGKRTSLNYLNHQLNAIEGVEDGVFFVPEARAATEAAGGVARLMAFAVAPKLSEQALRTALRERIDPAFMPRPLYRVDALPRNSTGKLPREALEALVQRLKGTRKHA